MTYFHRVFSSSTTMMIDDAIIFRSDFCSSEAAQQPGIFTLRSSSHMDPTTVALLQESENTAIGIRVQYHSLKRVAHPPHPENADYSSYSDEWTWLVRSEWFKMPVTIKATDASENDLQVNQDIKPMFHGTEWGSALQICASGMFIVGAGTHGIRGKSKSGCWCVPTLPDALVRADPRRYAQGPVECSRLCCPRCSGVEGSDTYQSSWDN